MGVRKTKYTYDEVGRLVKTEYPDGAFTATRHYPLPEDAEEQILTTNALFYDDAALGIAGWAGRAEVQLARDGKISVTKYDLAGRTKESYTLAEDAEGDLHLRGSETEYNSKGQTWKSYRLTGVNGSVERTLLSSSHYDANGRLDYTEDELTGAKTLYGYDATGRQVWTAAQKASDTPDEYVYTANEYDKDYGRLIRVHYGLPSAPTDELYFDGLSGTPPIASLPAGQTYVRYEYDAEGRKIRDIAPNDSGEETTTFYVYDDEGRQTKVVHNYNEATYPSGHGAANDENIIYETVYNQYGQRTELIDAEGHSTWFEYDDFGRLKRKTLEKVGDDPYEEYTYDRGRGLLIKKRNFDGSTVTYQYDAQTDRRIKATYSDGYEVEFEHDGVTGRLLWVKEYRDGALRRTTSYAYDAVTGRPSLVAKDEGRLAYRYNSRGQLAAVWTPGAAPELEPGSGLHYEYYYDDVGRLKTVETPSGEAEYAYYVNGSRKTLTLPNSVTTTYIYDDLLRLDMVEHRDSGLNLLAEFDYTVGRTGKRSGVAEEIDGVTSAWQYEYDGLGRICDATRETSGSAALVYDYQYDLVGNRTEKSVGATTTTYEYNALDQLETETAPGGVINYDYDANGNLKYKSSAGQETNYVYDARNKLKQVYQGAILDGNLAVEFAYDFSGNRYAKSTRAGQDFEHERFLIDNNNLTGYSQTFLEYEYYTGVVEKRYEYGDDLYCEATPLPSSPVNGGGDVTNAYFLYDGLGSTRSLTNSDGEIAQSYNYHPFGEGIDQPQNLSTNHLFTGEYFDSDLDYYYLRARYYEPSVGRFTSHDPIEDQANKLHKYLYCGNDTVNCVDPLGKGIILIIGLPILLAMAVAMVVDQIHAAFKNSKVKSYFKEWEKFNQEHFPDIYNFVQYHGSPLFKISTLLTLGANAKYNYLFRKIFIKPSIINEDKVYGFKTLNHEVVHAMIHQIYGITDKALHERLAWAWAEYTMFIYFYHYEWTEEGRKVAWETQGRRPREDYLWVKPTVTSFPIVDNYQENPSTWDINPTGSTY